MSCCGVSVQSQRSHTAAQQGLSKVSYATADPNEAGSHWRSDWDKVKVIFNGQKAAANTIARASSEGWAEFYMFNVKTGQIGEDNGQPMVKRQNGVVEIYAPSSYQLDLAAREQSKQSQWWPKR